MILQLPIFQFEYTHTETHTQTQTDRQTDRQTHTHTTSPDQLHFGICRGRARGRESVCMYTLRERETHIGRE